MWILLSLESKIHDNPNRSVQGLRAVLPLVGPHEIQ